MFANALCAFILGQMKHVWIYGSYATGFAISAVRRFRKTSWG